MLKWTSKPEKALRITLSIEKDVSEYALNFLHIWNNAREYPNMFYKVENNSGCDVIVTYNPKYDDEIHEYLEQFGRIWCKEEIKWVVVSPIYDFSGWSVLFDEEKETDFTVIVE